MAEYYYFCWHQRRGTLISVTSLVFIFIFAISMEDVHGYAVDQLYRDLFKNYIKYVRPQCARDDNVTLKMDLSLRQIIELNEPKQMLSINAWIRMYWNDCRLAWNPGNYSMVDTLIVPYDRVWLPDLTLYDNKSTCVTLRSNNWIVDSAEDKLAGMEDYSATIGKEGNMFYNFPSVITSLCSIDVTYFPFDVQTCSLDFGSWAYHGLDLDVVQISDEVDLKNFVKSIEWEVQKHPIKRRVDLYDGVPYPVIRCSFQLQRKPLFYIMNIISPCLLITFVAVFGFMLPPESGEKVSLAITVLLSLAVFQLIVLETMPASGESTPFIGIYFMVSMVLVGMSCLMTVIVLQIHYKGNNGLKMSRGIKQCIMKPLSRITCVNMSHISMKCIGEQPNYCYKIPNGPMQCGNEDDIKTNSPIVSEDELENHSSFPDFQRVPLKRNHPLYNILNDILGSLQGIQDYLKAKEDDALMQSEWSLLAVMLDRLMMVVYLVITTTVTLSLLLPVLL